MTFTEPVLRHEVWYSAKRDPKIHSRGGWVLKVLRGTTGVTPERDLLVLHVLTASTRKEPVLHTLRLHVEV